ncbi:hypothetical protein [Thermocatellispora tengchongensis]
MSTAATTSARWACAASAGMCECAAIAPAPTIATLALRPLRSPLNW